MPNPFPSYGKELERFIEISPAIARRDFYWLCVNKEEQMRDSNQLPGLWKELNNVDDWSERKLKFMKEKIAPTPPKTSVPKAKTKERVSGKITLGHNLKP